MQHVSRSGEKGGPPAFGWWWKVECCMWIHGICCSSLFYKRGYSQNPPPVPLQEAHRPAILKLRHRPTSVQDVPTCEPLARTDHEPKAHLCMLGYREACCCTFDSYSALKQTIRLQEWLCHSRFRMVQSLQITGVKRNVLFLQRARMQKLIKGKHEKRCSFLERKGDRRSRWIVDSTLFE